jgi:hypothetical protein
VLNTNANIKCKEEDKCILLYYVCSDEKLEAAWMLINNGAAVFCRDDDGHTRSQVAVNYEDADVV